MIEVMVRVVARRTLPFVLMDSRQMVQLSTRFFASGKLSGPERCVFELKNLEEELFDDVCCSS